ncbi:MAG: hypothetical protein JWO06_959 [Bacteroidota bacterium]|nr:hypothetical protein [Bacteroidota bacterium]
MNAKIVLRKDKKNAHGLCPVVIQISEGKEVARIPLGFTLKAEDFDQETQTVLKQHSEHKNYNQIIAKAKSKIELINNEVSRLQYDRSAIGLPKVTAFKELYSAEEEAYDSILKKYDDNYGVQTTTVAYPNGREFRIPINYKIQPEKYDEAISLLRKFSKGESDSQLDELLARQERVEADDANGEKESFFLEAWDKYYKHCLREKSSNTSIRIPNNLQILKSFSA